MTLSCCICQQLPRYQIRPGVFSACCVRQQCLRAYLLREPWRCPKCQSMDFRRLDMQWDSKDRKLYYCGKCKKNIAVGNRVRFEVIAVHQEEDKI